MKRGFTLMEVLIALAIMSMVMATVMQTVDQTRKAVDAIHNVMETETTGPRILDTMRRDLDSLLVYDAANYQVLKGVNQNIMGAEADKLDLIVQRRGTLPVRIPNRQEPAYAPINEVGYRLRQNPYRPDFMELYRREDALVDDQPFRDGSFTLLYDRVISLDIRYAEEPELNPVWKDSWDSMERQALPYAMDIFLEIEIQPRRSLESLHILGANRARLEFEDVFHFPEARRWRFRNRLHPQLPGTQSQDQAGELPGSEETDAEKIQGASQGTGQGATLDASGGN